MIVPNRWVYVLFPFGCCSLTPVVEVVVEMDGENKIIGPGKLLRTHSVQGDVTQRKQEQTNSTGEAFFFLLVALN